MNSPKVTGQDYISFIIAPPRDVTTTWKPSPPAKAPRRTGTQCFYTASDAPWTRSTKALAGNASAHWFDKRDSGTRWFDTGKDLLTAHQPCLPALVGQAARRGRGH